MDFGMMMVFASYGWDACPDDQVWDEEIRLARLAADSGFDVLWSAEHHFNDYGLCPVPPVLAAFVAARTSTLRLGMHRRRACNASGDLARHRLRTSTSSRPRRHGARNCRPSVTP